MQSRKFLSIFSIALFLCGSLSAQFNTATGIQAEEILKGAQVVRYNDNNKLPIYGKFYSENAPEKSTFIEYIKKELGFDASVDFVLTNSRKDKLGFLHEKYSQQFEGTSYAYVSLNVHSKNGKVISFNGNFLMETPVQKEVSLSFSRAMNIAKNEVNASEYYSEENAKNKSDLVFLNVEGDNGKLELKRCYRINIYARNPLSRDLIFVNASSGEIEFKENLIHTGKAEGTAITAYSDTQAIITDSLTSYYRLVDTTRGDGVETYNCETTRNYASAVDFIDSNNVWNNVNFDLDQYATDAHWATEEMYDYLLNAHNYNSIDDSGFALKTYMHYDVNYVNAFWDGQRMTYGDGDQNRTPLSTIDIVGHEVAHGLTEFSAGLIYESESGALNESFSDIFGTVLEFEARPNNANWTVGEDIGGAFRSMESPKVYGSPDTYEGQFWVPQNCVPSRSNDYCGVHSNSGVQNRWFYLVAQGDTGVNDRADSFQVSGIGMKKAAEVSFRNLTVYLTPSSNHEDARFYSIVSAIDLYGACSPEVEAVTNAWYAVGVGVEYKNEVSASFTAVYDTSYCSSFETIAFESIGSNVINFRWDFGNGDTSNLRNPSTVYDSLGSYDVSLIADGGGCGSDTILKQAYIKLDTSIACAYALNDGVNQVIQSCTGRIMDSGGINADYGSEEEGYLTIDANGADFIELSFIDLSIEAGDGFSCNRDYIEVYDGDSSDAPSLGRYCQNNLPIGNKITSSSNKLFIRFKSDNLFTDSGFLLSWECKSSSQSPVADFVANTDTSCSGEVSFSNQTLNGASEFTWDFGDGKSSNEINPTHEYKTNGTYSVKLVAENSIAIDSITKNSIIQVDRPAPPTVSNDTFCLGATAGIKVNSTENIEWYRDTLEASVFSGDSVTLFNLTSDTTLYIREFSKEQKFNGGALLNNIGAGNYSSDNDYIEFDVHEAVMINSILFFSNKQGTRTLDIRNSEGQLVKSKEIYVSASPLIVNINIALQPDTNYRISLSSKLGGLYKNTAGASFPYNISNLITLNGSNLSSGGYPYFYRWSVSKLSCVSNFKQVGATADSSCIITGVDQASVSDQISVYPNPVRSELIIKNKALSQNSQVEIKLFSATGSLVFDHSAFNLDRSFNINMEAFPTGVYYLRTVINGKVGTHKIVKLD